MRFLSCLLVTMGKTRKSFYAVRTGRNAGVYSTWEECQAQVNGFSGAVYKGFSTRVEADQFVTQGRPSSAARSSYAGDFGYTASGSRSGGSRYFSSGPSSYYRSRQYSSSSASSSGLQQYLSSGPSSDEQHSRPVVYSDGCCFGNGKRGATAGVGVYWGDDHTYNVSEKLEGHPTNQRAELVSACRALETAVQQGHNEVELRTDSSYTIKAMTEWISTWKKNGWITGTREPVKNQDDIQRLDTLCQQIDVKWTHVPGHRGIQGNEAADSLAKAGAQK